MRKKINLILILVILSLAASGCESSPKIVTTPVVAYAAGVKTAQGEVKGKIGEIKIMVAVEDNKILDVRILENRETPSHASKALEQIPKEIVKRQSLDIDAVSGATVTSDAILKGVEETLRKLGIDKSTLK